ncbi:oxygen-insensitive NADPH nitroreductase [Alkalicoccobacillus porphyridii]|uniref:Oxygen-insensitive NADPH nitroreductase n=1 Tax=Alkalicoccobacillus porphyridii TaxID=2597270 RepID=A0A553ZWI2_9BACI|nr:oxygen-insensitive NADPH nitroreductase [Alkalicoccobacillus porphyridii]TSB45827.1 oxygen-insensitive NADPH nitroreductase [Alkalicoccobacillus porphyridii]
MTNDFIQTMSAHRSIRKFTTQDVSKEQVEAIISAARWAPSSHHVQAYSVIVVKNPSTKQTLSELTGNQRWVEQCPVFLVFCADYHKISEASERHGQALEIGGAEQLLVGAVDAALVAQNTLLAAESMGLGGVMIGGIRNQPGEVTKLLNLPLHTFPVMGMCLGYPDQDVDQKPRLPQKASVFYEAYDQSFVPDALDAYNETMEHYYLSRKSNARGDTWSKQMAAYMGKPNRPHLNQYLLSQGFLHDVKKESE